MNIYIFTTEKGDLNYVNKKYSFMTESNEKDIDMVMELAKVDFPTADKYLFKNYGDIVNTINELRDIDN